jgi:TetR/AcrR family transcriptional regulator, transcriptional repressor of aconitase
MPRITDERREARREQILEAARDCLQDHGLEAVSMEMIITRSGLSTGAVYGYFKGKDEIISSVVTDGTAAMGRQLALVLRNPEPLRLPQFTDQMLRAIADFGQDKHDGIDRLLVSLPGWSHSQSDPGLKGPTRVGYRRQRELFAGTVRQWQAAGTFDAAADPDGVAQLLMSIILGFAAQRALAGDADAQAHIDTLETPWRGSPLGQPLRRPRAPDRHNQRSSGYRGKPINSATPSWKLAALAGTWRRRW